MIKNRIIRIISLFLVIYLLFCNTIVCVNAEETPILGGQSNIINGGFESPYLVENDERDSGYAFALNTEVEGWNTTAIDNKIEMAWLTSKGTSPHMVPTTIVEIIGNDGAADGYQFCEPYGNEKSSIYQKIPVLFNNTYNWEIYHRGRQGVDILSIIIIDDNGVNHNKADKTEKDHFLQAIEWMQAQGITGPSKGNIEEYTIYSTEMLDGVEFTESNSGSYFSMNLDEEHTIKWTIFLMASNKGGWTKHQGNFLADKDKDILFVVSPYSASPDASGKYIANGGNLVDRISFNNTLNDENLLINGGFDNFKISTAYSTNVKAANNSSHATDIGWSTTSSDKCLELGNISKGNSYGFNCTVQSTILNAPSIREGKQFAELNANEESSLYQIVTTDVGKMYKWSLSHRARELKDTMALIIGPSQDYLPQKVTAQSRDQLMQIVDWMQSQTEKALDIPEQGCSDMITLYSSKFAANGKYVLNSNPFSWTEDAEHTEKWSVWIISSSNDSWHDYGELDESATYDYKYIVPEGQSSSIFGFVSVDAITASGSKNLTYGNLLDNISFKEYYYINISNPANSNGGNVYITNEDGTFIFETPSSGWALVGSDIKIHITEGDREFIGSFIDNEGFINKDNWVYDPETDEYIYSFDNIDSSKGVDIKYVAKTVVYDTCNAYPYDYDNMGSGFEIPMGAAFSEYISHAPIYDDGWEFIGWEYVSPRDGTVYLLNAEHKIVYIENTEDERLSTFEIYNIMPDNSEILVIDDISMNEGITFKAVWKYRQRVSVKTFNNDSASYLDNMDGGYVNLEVLSGVSATAYDYVVDGEIRGRELFSSSNNTYIQLSAHNKIGYTFNGWYDAKGQLVSTSVSYTYKVKEGAVELLYAYFEPVGYNIVINHDVLGNFADTLKYFAIRFNFSNLRPEKVYMITGLYGGQINVDGETVTNPVRIKADESGNASVTLYMKDKESVSLVYLPENAIYTVDVDDYSHLGYTTIGETFNSVLSGLAEVNIIENNEISPPTGVKIDIEYSNVMFTMGACLLILLLIEQKIKKRAGDEYE